MQGTTPAVYLLSYFMWYRFPPRCCGTKWYRYQLFTWPISQFQHPVSMPARQPITAVNANLTYEYNTSEVCLRRRCATGSGVARVVCLWSWSKSRKPKASVVTTNRSHRGGSTLFSWCMHPTHTYGTYIPLVAAVFLAYKPEPPLALLSPSRPRFLFFCL